MAKLRGGGIRALFGRQQIKDALDEQQLKWEKQILDTLFYVGETFVTDARNNHTFQNRTGNLEASIGYVVMKDGKVIKSDFESGIGGQKAQETFAKVAPDYQEGFVLIGVAGMEYAAAVEAKKYDVITGSVPTVEFLKDIFDGIDI